jgi:hypothetical protein
MQSRRSAWKTRAQFLDTLDPRLGSLSRRATGNAIPNPVGLTTPPAHRPAVVQLKKASASIALRANEKTPFAAIAKLAVLNLDFVLQRALALTK